MLTPVETAVLEQVDTDLGWSLIETFSRQFRCLPDEVRQGAEQLRTRLLEAGLDPVTHQAEIYLGIPISAQVRVAGQVIPAKASALSPQAAVTGPALRLPSRKGVGRLHSGDPAVLFDFGTEPAEAVLARVRGRIVVTDGLSNPARTRLLEDLGALGVIVVNPGDRSHWGTNSLIWGNPDDRTMAELPRITSIAVPHAAGPALLAACAAGAPVTLEAEMLHGWHEQPVLTVDVHPTGGPSADFVLLHSHYDSWEVGVGDNATGNAVLLEVARLLSRNRQHLTRTIRFAWWPGHSAGRYAGSTWYADHFGRALHEHCVAHVNCDSPGCRGATSYASIRGMIEAEPLVAGAIMDLFGQPTELTSPGRAGDYSFCNLGITGCMLTSSMVPEQERHARGWYAVGGCGGDPAWHSEYDTMEIADRAVLANDIRLYALLALRLSARGRLPLDYRRTMARLSPHLAALAGNATSALGQDFGLMKALASVETGLEAYYRSDRDAAAWNRELLALSREIVRLGYAASGIHDQDPARPAGPLPLADGLLEQDAGATPACRTRLLRATQDAVHRLRLIPKAARLKSTVLGDELI